VRFMALGFMSRPSAFLASSFASMRVVPAPTIGSRIESFLLEYISIMLRAI